MYTWKYHKETPCVATFITNGKNVMFFLFFFFYKIVEQSAVLVLPNAELVTVGWGRRCGKCKYCCIHMHVNAKMVLLNLFQECGEGR
jgi:hypothetical protein